MEVDTEDIIEQVEVAAASEWATLEETEQMSTEEFIAYMANLDSSSQKVLLNINYVINTCVKYNDLKGTIDRVVESNHVVSNQLKKLKEEKMAIDLQKILTDYQAKKARTASVSRTHRDCEPNQ